MYTQGRIQDFPKGGVGTRDTKSGVGGGCPLQARDEKGGGRGAIRFRPDTKSGGGGGGGGGGVGCCPLQARYKKRGVCVCVGGVMLST